MRGGRPFYFILPASVGGCVVSVEMFGDGDGLAGCGSCSVHFTPEGAVTPLRISSVFLNRSFDIPFTGHG